MCVNSPEFYVSTLAGRSPEEWEPLRWEFLDLEIVPHSGRRPCAG